MHLGTRLEKPLQDMYNPKFKGKKFPFILIVALQQRLISEEQFELCMQYCSGAEDKNKAVMEYLKKRGILGDEKSQQLDDIYTFFITRQKDARFGALCACSKMVPRMIVGLALEEQLDWYTRTGERKMLGTFLVENGMISRRQCELLLQKQKREWRAEELDRISETPSPVPIASEEEHLEGLGLKSADSTASAEKNLSLAAVPMKEIRKDDLVLKIQHDGLAAFLIKTPTFSSATTVDDLRRFLDENHIVFGIVERHQLQKFIDGSFSEGHYYPVANGMPPVQHQPAQIDYVVASDYLHAGFVSDDGSIDFKDRGRIPGVNAGDLIAEKKPGVPGKPGCNIYGETLTPDPVMAAKIKCGNGVSLSDDGLKVYATISGYPKVDIDGTIGIVQIYTINGNVDYSTGHINFDGNVIITGVIKNGFKVTAHDIDADGIEGGEVESSGDIRIRQGISKAKVIARGNVLAHYIHHSDITCMGSLDVEKEILDSTLVANGACYSSAGRVLSSTIYAKMGARLHTVGTEQTRFSTITVGISKYTEMEISRLNLLIDQLQKQIDQDSMRIDSVDSEKNNITSEISRMELSRKDVEANLEEMKRKNVDNKSEEVRNVIEILEFNVTKAGQDIKQLKIKQADLEIEKSAAEDAIDANTRTVQKHIKEMLILKRIDSETDPKPCLDVLGQIMPGTRINGRTGKLVLKNLESRVRIYEVGAKSGSDSEGDSGVMEIVPLIK